MTKIRFHAHLWHAMLLRGKYASLRRYILVSLLVLLLLYSTIIEDERYPYQEDHLFHDELMDSLKASDENFEDHKNVDNYKCNIYNVTKNPNDQFEYVKTKTRPWFYICIYDEWRDMYISHDLKYTGIWEPQVLKDFQEILLWNPNVGVIDVGANIGFYTILAAKMKHKVIAVEPFMDSVKRIHKSAWLGRVEERIIIVQNAVADVRMKATIKFSGDNQGDTRIKLDSMPCLGSCPPVVNTIILDDLLETIPFSMREAIMKFDIQGFEHKAFAHASKLFKVVDIKYIFMEWMLMKDHFVAMNHTSTDKYLVQEMLRFLFESSYRPYALSVDKGVALDPNHWNTWPDDIIWRKMLSTKEYEKVIAHQYVNWPL